MLGLGARLRQALLVQGNTLSPGPTAHKTPPRVWGTLWPGPTPPTTLSWLRDSASRPRSEKMPLTVPRACSMPTDLQRATQKNVVLTAGTQRAATPYPFTATQQMSLLNRHGVR